jgi:hypothetical protein
MENIMGRKLVVRIEHDSDVEVPDSGYDGWKLVSFGRRHSNYEDPDKYIRRYNREEGIVVEGIGLLRKLNVGLAFWLSYYEHGLGCWSLKGEGPQCQWDTAHLAGILLWTGKPGDIGAKTLEDRAKDARCFLESYNDWANGNCYWYSVEKTDGTDVETVGGFIGDEAVNEALAEVLEAGDVVTVEGDASFAFDAPEGVEVVDEHEEDEERHEDEDTLAFLYGDGI